MVRFVLMLLLIAAVVGFVYRLSQKRRARGRSPLGRAEEAAELRRRLIRLVHDAETADRLAEGELERSPDADMATCYRRALTRIERERSR